MDQKEIDYLRGEYEFMSVESLEEMISYGEKQYEPEVWTLLNEIVASKKSDSNDDQEDIVVDNEQDQEHTIDGYIALVQTQNNDEADKYADLLDEHDIDYYFEPFHAGIVRENDPHSFIVVKVNHYNRAMELLLPMIPGAKART